MEAVTVDNQNQVLSNSCDVSKFMPIVSTRKAKVAHPTGDPKFEVMQPFPSALAAEETDPFLMVLKLIQTNFPLTGILTEGWIYYLT